MRTEGAKNIEEVSNKKISVRLPERLLVQLDALALAHGQKRSEALLEAIRDYVRKG